MKPLVTVLLLVLVAAGVFSTCADHDGTASIAVAAAPSASSVSAPRPSGAGASAGFGEGDVSWARTRRDEGHVRILRDAVDEDLRLLEADLRQAIQMNGVEERRVALAAVCVRWAKIDPADALALARELCFEDMSGAVQADIIQHWATINLVAARAWIDRETQGEQRENLLARLAFVWSQTQPRAAARLVADQISPGPAQEEAGISVLHQWALRDFAAAFAWADRFPAGTSRERALEELNHISGQRIAPRGAELIR